MLRQLAIFTLWRTSRKEKWRESAVSERVWINHKFQVTHTFTYTFMHTTNTHTVLVCECRLSPRARWLTVLFFRSSEWRLWADAITSVPSTCQVPLLALTVAVERAGGWAGGRGWTLDAILDPVPASVCQVCITVHFPASSLLRCAQPSLSAGVSLQKNSATTQGCSSLRSDSEWQAVVSTL